jgi:hypothetical protein
MQDIDDFLREFMDYYFSQVHTSLPGAVIEYDAAKRRATVQPSLKRRAGNKEYIAFPLLIDVPVQFPGTKKWTIHFPLEENDEVAVFFSERALEAWKDVGQDGIEDPDPRRYDLCDAYCTPGLQAQEFIAATEPGLQIIHKDKFDGKLISQMLMTDDKVEMKHKKLIFCLKGDKVSVRNGSKSLYTIWHTLLQTLKTIQPTTFGSPATHNWNPAITTAIGTADTDLTALLEA